MDREPTAAETEAGAAGGMAGKLASWAAHTLERGAGTDDTPDPEPWDDAEGEPRSGEEGVGAGSFMPDIGGPVAPGEAEPVAVVISERVPVDTDRPAEWTTRASTLDPNQATRIAGRQPRRYSLLVTNTHATESCSLGPSESECFRTLAAGESWSAVHTAEVWAIGNGVTVEVDETLKA